jgi:dihydroorotate dehydrogenase
MPLIAVGGIEDGDTALAKIEAGAWALQLYTGLVYRGLGLIEEILARLAAEVAAAGVRDLAGLRGRAAARWAAEPLDQPAPLA